MAKRPRRNHLGPIRAVHLPDPASVLCWLSGLECSFGGAPPPPRPPSPAPPSSRNGSSPKLGDPSGFRWFDWSAGWDAGKRGLKVIGLSMISPAAGFGAAVGAARGKDIDVGEALGAAWDKTYDLCFSPMSAAGWGGGAGWARALGSSFASSGKVYVVTCSTIFVGGIMGDVWGQALA